MKLQKSLFLLVAFAVVFVSCDDSSSSGPAPTEAVVAADIIGDPSTVSSTDSTIVEGDTDNSPGYTFFDLETGSVVSDSNSSAWDIAFGGTTILANSGNGGGIQKVEMAYGDIAEAPTDGYAASNADWYLYTAEIPGYPEHAILPNDGEALLIYTPDGNYAKVNIQSYYEGDPDINSAEFANLGTRSATRFFTFDYSIQMDGANDFSDTKWTYFDFETGTIVDDEASSQWDIAFQSTTIRANADNGGGVLEVNIAFEDFIEAPVDGYSDSNSSWYTYTGSAPTGAQHAVLPNEDVTLAFITGTGLYAKVRMLSYYEGNPDVTSDTFVDLATRSASRYFTFEYAVQTDGSTLFE